MSNLCKKHNCELSIIKDSSVKSGVRLRCSVCRKEYNNLYKQKANFNRRKNYLKNKNKIKNYYYLRMQSDLIRWRAESIYHSMKTTKRVSNVEIDDVYFTVENIKNKISNISNCPCCGCLFNYGILKSGKKNLQAPSADRFDSNIGYVKGNVNFICWNCNKLKRNSTIKDLELVIQYIKNKMIK